MSESRVTWATSVAILVFLILIGLSVLELDPMYATYKLIDVRQTSDVRQKHRGGGIITQRWTGENSVTGYMNRRCIETSDNI